MVENWNGLELPKAYYKDDAVYIINGDCREVLPQIPDKSIDLVLTDPPYVGLDSNTTIMFRGGVGKVYNDTKTVGDIWNASHEWIPLVLPKVRMGMLVFCSFHAVADIPSLVQREPLILITWHKRNSPPSRHNAPHYTTEFIWAFRFDVGFNCHALESLYDIPKLSTGCMASAERIVNNNGQAEHPTQKPSVLISELLKVGGEIILDPFLGSGTTAYCAKKLGRKCIGIEIDEKYCEIAAKRCSQSVMRLEV